MILSLSSGPWYRVVLAAVLLVQAVGGSAVRDAERPLVEALAWRQDHAGTATLDDVRRATDWQPFAGWKSWGFGPGTVWVKIRLTAADAAATTPWAVRVRPAYLDYVTLHDPAAGLTLPAGDALPPTAATLASINFTFQIPPLPRERDIYLQIRSSSTRMLQLDVRPSAEVQRQDRLQEWGVAFIITAATVIAGWAFVQWWLTREPVIGAFAVRQFLAVAWGFFFLGYARVVIGPFLPVGVLTTLASAIGAWLTGAAVWFLATLVQGYRPARPALRACFGLAIVLASLSVMPALGFARPMLVLVNAGLPLAFLLLIATLATAVPARVAQPVPIGWLLFYLGVSGTLSSTPALIHLGLLREHPIALVGTAANILLDTIVMFTVLQLRARAAERQQRQNELELLSSREQVRAAMENHAEQSRLFAMLAHEMKTPLAALAMWTNAGRLEPGAVQRTMLVMNQIIERCVHAGQLAEGGLRPTPEAVDGIELTRACITSCRDPARVDFVAPDGRGAFHADGQMLAIVLANLLDNACKYGAPGSRIEVTLQAASEDGRPGWRWAVANAVGPAGVPEADHLFEKYYRGPQARRLTGSGLGLFLVKGLLQLMHGSIRFDAKGGQAVFSIWLPQRQPA